jgi:hypothetical protein
MSVSEDFPDRRGARVKGDDEPVKSRNPRRDEQMRALRKSGESVKALAVRFGLSAARVSQICKPEAAVRNRRRNREYGRRVREAERSQ